MDETLPDRPGSVHPSFAARGWLAGMRAAGRRSSRSPSTGMTEFYEPGQRSIDSTNAYKY
jgi:hypothetical protein